MWYFSKVFPRLSRDAKVLWCQFIGFGALIIYTWLARTTELGYILFDRPEGNSWHEALLDTLLIAAVWFGVYIITKRLLHRLQDAENYVRLCLVCRKISHGPDWIPMEDYLSLKLGKSTSHSMCPSCNNQVISKLNHPRSELQSLRNWDH